MRILKAFALSGCRAKYCLYSGCCPGLGASALSGRVEPRSFALYLSATHRWPLVQGIWSQGAFGLSAHTQTTYESSVG